MINNPLTLSLIVAADENNVIGKDNTLPWCLPSDLRYFKNQTWGMPVLMGRKTFESLGKPLSGRKSIVITHNKNWSYKGVDSVQSLNDAIQKARDYGAKEIFVLGGAEIFRSSIQDADRIYLTRIHHKFEGDVYFPEINKDNWKLVRNVFHPSDDKNQFPHTFQIWEKKTLNLSK